MSRRTTYCILGVILVGAILFIASVPTNVTLVPEQVPIASKPPQQIQIVSSPRSEPTEKPAVVLPVGGGDTCFQGPDFPLSPLEQELKRLYMMTIDAMAEINATYWPADATLLGLMRNGRVATDRDLDFQIHSTYDQCFSFLSSFKALFAKRAKLKSFKVATTKRNGKKIGRYVMVRMFREHGTFDTGVDFNCVYIDDPSTPKFFTHKNALTPVPESVYPLGRCSMYGTSVPCPRNGMAFLDTLKPRYDGCMAFPHCMGDPLQSVRRCMSPHPQRPMEEFVQVIKDLDRCGFTSLKDHFETHPDCPKVLNGEKKCEMISGSEFCFLQAFKD